MRPSLTAPVLALAAALILPLAACKRRRRVSATNATPEEVRAKVAAGGRRRCHGQARPLGGHLHDAGYGDARHAPAGAIRN